MLVVKRDGQRVEFDITRIKNAIMKAATACNHEISAERLSGMCGSIKGKLEYQEQSNALTEISVEAIQDIVETELMNFDDLNDIAKAYILYRRERTQVRELNTGLMRTLKGIFSVRSEDNDLKRENANINADAPMGVMLKVGSESTKDYSLKFLMKPEHAKAHIEGDIHIHDLDFYPSTETCVQIPLGKLLKNGFTTGHGYLRPPQTIGSASALTCIAIQSSQNDMHGGQSVPCFDYDLAPYVAKTFIRDILDVVLEFKVFLAEMPANAKLEARKKFAFTKALDNHYDIHGSLIDNESKDVVKGIISDTFNFSAEQAEKIYTLAKERTQSKTYQAMEALVHNLNTMNSRAGSQVPFSSVNMGTCVSEEGREITRNLLLAMESGLGHHETSFFPVVIFRMKEGVNFNKEDKNYDLFKLAIKVSAKRLFPCFSNVDAPFNKQYYKEGRPETEIAYMGCVDGKELVTYMIGDETYISSISVLYERYTAMLVRAIKGHDTEKPCKIYDSANGWVKLQDVFCNNSITSAYIGWNELVLSNGQVMRVTSDHPFRVKRGEREEYRRVRDLKLGDDIVTADIKNGYSQVVTKTGIMTTDEAYVLGLLVARGYRVDKNMSLYSQMVEKMTVDLSKNVNYALIGLKIGKVERTGYNSKIDLERLKSVLKFEYSDYNKDIYIDISSLLSFESKLGIINESYIAIDGGFNMNNIPEKIFYADKLTRLAFLHGFFDASPSVLSVKTDTEGKVYGSYRGSTKTALYTSLSALLRSVDSYTWVDDVDINNPTKACFNFVFTELLGNLLLPSDKETKEVYPSTAYKVVTVPKTLKVIANNSIVNNACSYDVVTVSGRFDVSGLSSHNCRTRVIGNVHDPDREITVGRGNLSFTSINLPRLGILAEHDMKKFYKLLDEKMELVKNQLLDRFAIQCSKHVYNYPMLMGQGEWIDSDKLYQNDSVAEILKHGSLSIGFIGLAECLTALIGKHHGESKEAQALGLEIIKHMRDYLDKVAEETKLNFGLLGTPAEGLSGRFVRIDKKRFGIIKGVTDKDYYTNSSHVPVNYPITAFKKLQIEAPYHEYENAGHIAYVELDGDPSKNLAAFEQVVRYMHDIGVGYGSINHIVDMDPICGYIGIIGDECPRCHRKDGEAMTPEMFNRIRGYTLYSSNLAFLGDMNEGLAELSDYKE